MRFDVVGMWRHHLKGTLVIEAFQALHGSVGVATEISQSFSIMLHCYWSLDNICVNKPSVTGA
jgi:hypothetical protein